MKKTFFHQYNIQGIRKNGLDQINKKFKNATLSYEHQHLNIFLNSALYVRILKRCSSYKSLMSSTSKDCKK